MEILSKRTSAVKTETDLSLVISANADKKKNQLLLLWLLLWTGCGVVIIYGYFQLSEQKMKIMTLVWIAFWLYFELLIMKAWRWKQFGREVIKIKDGELRYKKDTNGRGFILSCKTAEIDDIYVPEDKTPKWTKMFGDGYWNTGKEMIVVRYNKDMEIRFGFQLDAAEAQMIRKLIGKYSRLQEKGS